MIVYNENPKGSKPIMITYDWEMDPNGGPAIERKTICIQPGGAIELELLNLRQKPTDMGDIRVCGLSVPQIMECYNFYLSQKGRKP